MQRRALRVVPFFFLLAHVAGERSAAAANAQWAPTGSLNYAREDADAVPLLDGRAFVVGGDRYGSPPTGANSAEIYDPTTKLWTRAASSTLTNLHNAVRMVDGRVLVTNGCGLDNFVTVVKKPHIPSLVAAGEQAPARLVRADDFVTENVSEEPRAHAANKEIERLDLIPQFCEVIDSPSRPIMRTRRSSGR